MHEFWEFTRKDEKWGLNMKRCKVHDTEFYAIDGCDICQGFREEE